MTVKDKLNNIIYNTSNSSQMSKYYMEANVDILKKIINNKLVKHPECMIGKPIRERVTQLQDITKGYINSFKSLSKVYFTQVGDEYLMGEFSDLISEHAVSELRKAAEQQRASQSVQPTVSGNTTVQDDNLDSSTTTPHEGKRTNSLMRSSSFRSFKVSPVKKLAEAKLSEHPLADIKSQICNLDGFIRSYINSENEMEARKRDIIKLEEDKKNLMLQIQNIQQAIVVFIKHSTTPTSVSGWKH